MVYVTVTNTDTVAHKPIMQELQEQKIEKPTTLPVDPCYMATWRSLDEKALIGMKNTSMYVYLFLIHNFIGNC